MPREQCQCGSKVLGMKRFRAKLPSKWSDNHDVAIVKECFWSSCRQSCLKCGQEGSVVGKNQRGRREGDGKKSVLTACNMLWQFLSLSSCDIKHQNVNHCILSYSGIRHLQHLTTIYDWFCGRPIWAAFLDCAGIGRSVWNYSHQFTQFGFKATSKNGLGQITSPQKWFGQKSSEK